jgi:hypothetical protein
MNCSNPVRDDPVYVDTASCIKSNSQGGHVYAIAGDLKVGNLKDDDCHVEVVTAISFFSYHYYADDHGSGGDWDIPNEKYSYSEIHRMLVGGFDVSWVSAACQDHCGDPNCNLSEITWSLDCNDYQYQYKTLLELFLGCVGKNNFTFFYFLITDDLYWFNPQFI